MKLEYGMYLKYGEDEDLARKFIDMAIGQGFPRGECDDYIKNFEVISLMPDEGIFYVEEDELKLYAEDWGLDTSDLEEIYASDLLGVLEPEIPLLSIVVINDKRGLVVDHKEDGVVCAGEIDGFYPYINIEEVYGTLYLKDVLEGSGSLPSLYHLRNLNTYKTLKAPKPRYTKKRLEELVGHSFELIEEE